MMYTAKMVKCNYNECNYIKSTKSDLIFNICPKCNKPTLSILNQDNAFDFIYTIIKPYLLENEQLVNKSNEVSIFQDNELQKTCSYLELINDHIEFLKDLVKDNLNNYSIEPNKATHSPSSIK